MFVPNGEEEAESSPPVVKSPESLARTALARSKSADLPSNGDSPTPAKKSVLSRVLGGRSERHSERLAEFRAICSAPIDLTSIAGYRPTDEQAAIIRAARDVMCGSEQRVLVVTAGAGAGKTSVLRMLEEALPGSGQYTAFNASLVADSKKKFRKCSVNTTHSLAYREVGRRYDARLKKPRVRSEWVAEQLGIAPYTIEMVPTPEVPTGVKVLPAGFLAGQVLTMVRRFCQSGDSEPDYGHFKYIDGIDSIMTGEDGDRRRSNANNQAVREYLLPFAIRAWDDLRDVDGVLPFTHDAYLKIWERSSPVIASDYILLDEAQDSAGVVLSILRQQKHAMLIFIGDAAQAIYGWRGAINAMAAFPDARTETLSMSFRFGQIIADVANSVLETLDAKTSLRMRGLPEIASRVGILKNPRCILCRTNAGTVSRIIQAVADGLRPFLIGGTAEVVDFLEAARELQSGQPTRHHDLCCFTNWMEVQSYVKTDEGEEMKLLVKLVDDFGVDAILKALKAMPSDEANADVVVSTAHKSKGREWDTVKLAGDFLTLSKMHDEEKRLLYVAATRAKYVLDISECPSFNEEDGIEARYTVPMPSEGSPVLGSSGIVPAVPAVVTTPAESVKTEPTRRKWETPIGFTFNMFDGKWRIRGPKGTAAGTEVEVTTKAGQKKRIRVGALVREFPEAGVYEVA